MQFQKPWSLPSLTFLFHKQQTSSRLNHHQTMNILKSSILLAILLKCVIASESVVNEDVIEVLEERWI